jgi:hypothetical protein
MVADQAFEPAADDLPHVRITRPNGQLLATIKLPEEPAGNGNRRDEYAVIQDYAVYAIISIRARPQSAQKEGPTHYVLVEVEGEKWLVLREADESGCFSIYEGVPAGLSTYNTLTELDLPPRVGHICPGDDQFAYIVDLEPYRLQRTPLTVLALTFVIDQI